VSYLTDFSYFPLERNYRMLLDRENRSKMDQLTSVVDSFSYFALIFSYFNNLKVIKVKSYAF
jgi:hypothetical protein